MAQDTTLQVRYSSLVEKKLRATSVFNALFNHRYEGTPSAGAVKIPVRTDMSAKLYDKTKGSVSSGAGTEESPYAYGMTTTSTSYETLILDNDYAVNELIDGFVANAVPDNLVADRLDSAGYALAKHIDDALIATLTTSGNYTSATTSETKIPAQIIDTIAQAVSANVDRSDMWIVVSPACYGGILKSDLFQNVATLQEVMNGQIGKFAGIPVIESPKLTDSHFIVGNKAYCHMVEEFKVPVSVKDLADGLHIGACAVQGRMVYGYKISKPATVFYK